MNPIRRPRLFPKWPALPTPPRLREVDDLRAERVVRAGFEALIKFGNILGAAKDAIEGEYFHTSMAERLIEATQNVMMFLTPELQVRLAEVVVPLESLELLAAKNLVDKYMIGDCQRAVGISILAVAFGDSLQKGGAPKPPGEEDPF